MKFSPGDIAACFGAGRKSRLIEWGTMNPWARSGLRCGPSHVAILCEHKEKMVWVESTSLCRRPCCIRHSIARGAQAHQPQDRIQDYIDEGGRVDQYRLTAIYQFSERESRLLSKILIDHFVRQGADYDLGGALFSGTRFLSLTALLPGADFQQLFCSEMLAAVLMRLGRMNLANPTRYNPARLLRELVRQGIYRYEGSTSCISGTDRLMESRSDSQSSLHIPQKG